MDGKAVNSCLILAVEAEGVEITTIEGLTSDDRLHPVQQAFIDSFAMQCGFCTPGMILSSVALLDRKKNPTEKEIREALKGNLCRCGAYENIIKAVKSA
jgi:aerobic-type carbon monoxide dehydrogenase small subunit (CoxS/CutS family)